MLTRLLLIAILPSIVRSTCFDPSPAFPVPAWTNGANDLRLALDDIATRLDDLIADEKHDASSFSVQVTSNTHSLWSRFHTARKRNSTRPGVEKVDGDSLFRIASITKTFTVLGLLYQHDAGHLNLDTPIAEYIAALSGASAGKLPWKDITLRALASQLSGIPRDFAQGDVLSAVPDPTLLGFPPVKHTPEVPECDQYSRNERACNGTDLVDWLRHTGRPVFAPNQESTYSNLAFELIGLALENATNVTYERYMQEAIFDPLDMKLTTIATPPDDSHAVLPLGRNYWDIDEGVQNPTGGIYSSADDMSKFVRYVLTHFNAIATGVNWLMPASWSGGSNSFYGMPWEIFRSDKVLHQSRRPVTFVTKGGGLPGYVSKISILPEYGLGITILVGFQDNGGELLGKLQEIVTVDLVRAAEAAIWNTVDKSYSGSYIAVDKHLNSSIAVVSSASTGLVLDSFISNGTDVLNSVVPKFFVDNSRPWRLQLVPTLLFKDEEKEQGEIWRLTPTYEKDDVDRGVLDDFCTTDIDTVMYAGLPINEMVFWHDEGVVELPGWRVKLRRIISKAEEPLVVQTS